MQTRNAQVMSRFMSAGAVTLMMLALPADANAQKVGSSAEGASRATCPDFGRDGPTAEPPFTTAPRLLNVGRAAQLAAQAGARLGSDRRTAHVWFLVDAEGRLRDVRLLKSSGALRGDSLLLDVARELRFAPASLNGAPVCLWFAAPITIGGG